ncbi:uncharacterized protein NECHADRAFT_86216 [Fusarium vanettenii 77-13-4]|uniref:Uncharacterized protein n=1 Tax=Fusarium vanettenii (strain ATCC MYA-4622 / CBS 123669 / FGSC 9596 / NRRL 45880 / 77-13-4) TaxID=660122 RepID=C7ZKN6_FUSV7|nr:uncharacterized protein NECHADRAFT_86216 [Fusarium vanettenii 77-13-4]EEU35473.1 predicted protein [Fusarium vanettenii 77-13-4]
MSQSATSQAHGPERSAKDEEIRWLNDKVRELTEARDRLGQDNRDLLSLVRTQSQTIQSIQRRRNEAHGPRRELGARSLKRQATQQLQDERLSALQAEVQKQCKLRREAVVAAEFAREQIQDLETDAEAHVAVRDKLVETEQARDLALARVAELERLQETPVWPGGSNELSAFYAKLAQDCDGLITQPVAPIEGYGGLCYLASLLADPVSVRNLKALAQSPTDSTPRCLQDVCDNGNIMRHLVDGRCPIHHRSTCYKVSVVRNPGDGTGKLVFEP